MSMPSRITSKFTLDQYLAIERESEERHIYLDGEIFAMAGESDRHGEITMNLAGQVQRQLQGTPCRGRTKDTKVRSGIGPLSGHSVQGMFSYPDIVVICGEREFHDDHKDVITNPTAIMEVLSASTEAFDRGEKFLRYRTWNPTLTDYVLVSQDKPHVEHFVKQKDGTWSLSDYTDLDASVTIASIGCTLKLADIYDGVTFGSPAYQA
jgi:Uma2 family endonuclease